MSDTFGYGLKLRYDTIRNNAYRVELGRTPQQQLAIMSLKPKESVPVEIHEVGQFIYIVSGRGHAIIDGELYSFSDGDALMIPAGVEHEIVNDGLQTVKFFTIYSPPETD